ncbi:polysaccharide deacetylase family protein [Paraflavisolibacter sp. H34]|uniref:polysaccharide deacetylase family protein n=1 Tax=Huijunlia imazamoxiresistens TaxID=3127457 RepID=UPI003018378F
MLKNLFTRRALVLMYHRVADLPADPWELAVSPENFAQQLELLQQKYNVVPVNRLVAQLRNQSVASKTVCLTFDDGYSDNSRLARPLLEKYNCPATFFIATGYVDRQAEFWWDELEGVILHSVQLPGTLQLQIGNEWFVYNLDSDCRLTEEQQRQQQRWRAYLPPPTRRCALYLELWRRLQPLPAAAIEEGLRQLQAWAGTPAPPRRENFPLAGHQLGELAGHPLFEIGLHTQTHPSLSRHSADIQQGEIAGCSRFLKERYGKTCTTFSYPYGNFNGDTLAIARQQKLEAVFTTHAQTVTNRAHPYRLGRFQVKNWNGAEFERQLRRWAQA